MDLYCPRPMRPRSWCSWERPYLLRVLDHHDHGVGHVHPHLHHGGGHQQLRLPPGEGFHHLLLFGGLHLAVEHPHGGGGEGLLHQLPILGDALQAAVVLLDQRADQVPLAALRPGASARSQRPGCRLSGLDEEGLDLLPPRGQLVQNGDVQIPVDHQGQRAGDGGGAHHQQVGGRPLLGQSGALPHPKPVLLVGDDQPQIPEGHLLAEQGVGANHQLDAPVAPGRCRASFFSPGFTEPGQQRARRCGQAPAARSGSDSAGWPGFPWGP